MRSSQREELPQIATKAVRWFRSHRRDLPWRRTKDPYRIWISECMLQQTQVATVIPYYERFLDRFPDVQALAAAELDEVYRYWAGLGYYRRAKQLHAAACEIVTSGQVPFPRDRDAIWSLPGIGRYTASAIASFAYDARWGIVEANTQRLYARLIRCRDPLAETKTQKQLWNFAEELVQAARGSAGELNQALMEIGALVCKPVEPSCTECPLVDHCQAHRHRETHRIPAPKPKKVITPLVEIGFLISDGAGRWLLRRCLESERWAGLWDFPRFDCTQAGSDEKAIRLGAEAFAERFGVRIRVGETGVDQQSGEPVLKLQHAVTRYRIELRVYEASLLSRRSIAKFKRSEGLGGEESIGWYPLEEIIELALSSSGRKVARWLERSREW